MTAPIMIRLDVEFMRHSIVHAFNQHTKELEETLDKEIRTVLAQFDFQTLVKDECQRLLRDYIKRALADAISNAFLQEGLRGIFKAGAERAVREAILNALKEDTD